MNHSEPQDIDVKTLSNEQKMLLLWQVVADSIQRRSPSKGSIQVYYETGILVNTLLLEKEQDK